MLIKYQVQLLGYGWRLNHIVRPGSFIVFSQKRNLRKISLFHINDFFRHYSELAGQVPFPVKKIKIKKILSAEGSSDDLQPMVVRAQFGSK